MKRVGMDGYPIQLSGSGYPDLAGFPLSCSFQLMVGQSLLFLES